MGLAISIAVGILLAGVGAFVLWLAVCFVIGVVALIAGLIRGEL